MATSSTSLSSVTGTISSAGVGSGLDVSTLVTQLMAVERRPLTQVQDQASKLETTLSNVGKLQSNFAALQTKANALTSLTLWNGTTASSSDNAYVRASTADGGVAGDYDISVARLASAQTLTSGTLAKASATVGSGTLTIELGSWGAGTPADGFTAKTDTTPVTVTIDDSHNTLEGIRDQINNAKAGVTAAIVTDATGARLTLRSSATGEENGFRITASESGDDGNAATGLSMLGFDAAAADSPMLRTTSAGNAQATINGIAVSSATNVLDGVVDGLKLTLIKPTTQDVQVSVNTNTDAIKSAITDFVSAFNTLASFLKTATAYNADSKTGGPLQGDQGTLALQSQLRGVINAESTASSTWGRLSAIGLALKTDGTLETNSTKLDNALGNLTELRKLLIADGATNAESGFVRRFKNLADTALGTDGLFDSRTQSLRATLDRNEKTQSDMEQRLSKTESRLRAQYQALDTKMASLNSLSSYVTKLYSSSSSG